MASTRVGDSDSTTATAAIAAFIAELEAPRTELRVPVDRRTKRPWGLGSVLLAIPLVIASSVIVALGVELVLDAFGLSEGPGRLGRLSLTLSMLTQQVAMIAWPVYVSWTRGRGPRIDFNLRFDRLRDDIGFGLAAGVAAICVAALTGMVMSLVVQLGDRTVSNTQLVSESTGSVWIVAIVLLVVVGAPVSEEIYFRGMMQTAGSRRFGPVVSVAGTTGLFALLHFNAAGWQASLVMLSVIASVGVALSMAVRASRSLLPAIVAHMLFNGMAILPLLIGA